MTITSFTGDHEWLSNAFACNVELDNEVYPSLEHAFQAAKTEDFLYRTQIKTTTSIREVRNIGRNLKLPSDWNQRRYDVMLELVRNKFNNNLDLKLKLLLTGTVELVQGGMRSDQYWGVDYNGVGDNILGKILMTVRDEIRSQEGSAESVLCKFLSDNKLGFVADKFVQMREYLLAYGNYDPDADDWG